MIENNKVKKKNSGNGDDTALNIQATTPAIVADVKKVPQKPIGFTSRGDDTENHPPVGWAVVFCDGMFCGTKILGGDVRCITLVCATELTIVAVGCNGHVCPR